jgi:hypothetical protein
LKRGLAFPYLSVILRSPSGKRPASGAAIRFEHLLTVALQARAQQTVIV